MNPYNYNPYEAPHASEAAFGGGGGGADQNAQAEILEAMKRTRPWVLFLSILGFLGTGVMLLLGVGTLIAGVAGAKLGSASDAMMPFLSLIYFFGGAFYAVPSFLLWQYGSAIGPFTRPGGASMETLAGAVKRQASFWRFSGISTAVLIGLYVLLIFVAVGVGVAKGLSR